MKKLLEVKALNVAYNGECNILKNIDIDVGYKEIIGIVGESGSGKTTLIRTIINLISSGGRMDSGKIIFDGFDISKYSDEKWKNIRGNEICMIFQNAGAFLNPIKKIGKQFEESIRCHLPLSREEAKEKATNTLDKMGFKDSLRIMNSYPFQLSGGMKQRVGIAMAIAMEPKLILADEPTSALDVITQKQIIEELMNLRENFNTSIIIVTHNIGCAAYMSDRIMVMKKGEIVEFGYTEDIINRPQKDYTIKLLDSILELKGC